MKRRDVLKLLGARAAIPALSSDLLAFYRVAQAHLGSSYTLRTLNPRQNDTVVAMIDQIIPATDTPGAKAARVNEFIDVILTEWATDDERQNFLNGVAAVDKQSNKLFGKDFSAASPAQQLTLLGAMDDAAINPRSQPRRRASNTEPARDTQLKGDFFVVFKQITMHGYYTSEIGFTQELNLQIIPGIHHGCVPLPEAKKV